ncbi:MAG: hypothetical protein KAW87_04385 [Candidatus Cloacimonetes bacterium]|nr:hypothetical protein [Candidatus Cloacimonadota bacterium]
MNNSGQRKYLVFWSSIAQILHPHQSMVHGEDNEVFLKNNEDEKFRNLEGSGKNMVRIRRRKRKYIIVNY